MGTTNSYRLQQLNIRLYLSIVISHRNQENPKNPKSDISSKEVNEISDLSQVKMILWSEFPFVDMSFILFRHFLNKSVPPKRPLVYVYTYNIYCQQNDFKDVDRCAICIFLTEVTFLCMLDIVRIKCITHYLANVRNTTETFIWKLKGLLGHNSDIDKCLFIKQFNFVDSWLLITIHMTESSALCPYVDTGQLWEWMGGVGIK